MEEPSWTSSGRISRKGKNIKGESIKIVELADPEIIDQLARKGEGVRTNSICKFDITDRNNWMTNTILRVLTRDATAS